MNNTLAAELHQIIYEAVRDALAERPEFCCYTAGAPTATEPPTQPSLELPPFMSPAQLAETLNVSVRTLDMWRANGSGPTPRNPDDTRFYRYYAADVLAWLENRKQMIATPNQDD